MFESLQPAPADKILALLSLYKADPREQKLDLGVGVYKDNSGTTPVMRAIREAEARLHEAQTTKTYVGIAGDAGFNEAMAKLVLGEDRPEERLRMVQAPGGSGALRILCELLNRARPGATVWLSDPTWPNHAPIARAAGLTVESYPYFDAETGGVRFDAMMETLRAVPQGDIIMLHGCCHNPTGANLTMAQWEEVADLLDERGLFPFVDIAYQGFGDGLEEDAAPVRLLTSKVPEMAIAASCSKNFALYRDRVGCAMLLGESAKSADLAIGNLSNIARGSYSMPPDHGAACVRIVMEDNALTMAWQEELTGMRERMLRLREGLAEALRRETNSDRFDFVAHHRGMFSRLGLSPEAVTSLRDDHGVYMIGDSRFNVAGLPEDGLEALARAIAKVA